MPVTGVVALASQRGRILLLTFVLFREALGPYLYRGRKRKHLPHNSDRALYTGGGRKVQVQKSERKTRQLGGVFGFFALALTLARVSEENPCKLVYRDLRECAINT